MKRFVPTFHDLSDEDLQRRLHCWEHCALVLCRSQRQVARMHVRCLREEIQRREASRLLAGSPAVATYASNDSRTGLPRA